MLLNLCTLYIIIIIIIITAFKLSIITVYHRCNQYRLCKYQSCVYLFFVRVCIEELSLYPVISLRRIRTRIYIYIYIYIYTLYLNSVSIYCIFYFTIVLLYI